MGNLRDALQRLNAHQETSDIPLITTPKTESSPIQRGNSGSFVVSIEGIQSAPMPPAPASSIPEVTPPRDRKQERIGEVLDALDRAVERTSNSPSTEHRLTIEPTVPLQDVPEPRAEVTDDEGQLPQLTDDLVDGNSSEAFLDRLQEIEPDLAEPSNGLLEPGYLAPALPDDTTEQEQHPPPGYEDPFADVAEGELPVRYNDGVGDGDWDDDRSPLEIDDWNSEPLSDEDYRDLPAQVLDAQVLEDEIIESADEAEPDAAVLDQTDPPVSQQGSVAEIHPTSTVTTDQTDVDDPVAMANEITGWLDDDVDTEEGLPLGLAVPAVAEVPAAIEPHEFERSVISNLQIPKIRKQYEDLWNNIYEGRLENTSLMLGLISAEPEEHVSRVLGHLGVWLTRELRNQVLLVDGDLRRRRLSSEFGLQTTPGLSNACLMECNWTDVVVPTSQQNMCILPAGTSPITTGDFDPFRLPFMASGWKEMFEIVLVDVGDAPSALTQPLCRACDRSYLLIRLGSTNRELADDLMDALLEGDVILKGCIVTNMP